MKKLKFKQQIFLIGGSDINAEQFLSIFKEFAKPIDDIQASNESYSECIAVDGGGNFLKELKIQSSVNSTGSTISTKLAAIHTNVKDIFPTAIIGDIDSLKNGEYWRDICSIYEISEQETTDLEKTLMHTEAPLYLGFGFLGKRFDHTLETLHIMQKYPEKNLVLFSSEDIIFAIPSDWKASLPNKIRFSVYPLDTTKIMSGTGWKYDISGLVFEQGKLIGTSNETIFEQCISSESSEHHLVNVSIKHNNHKMILGITPIQYYKNIINSLT